MDLKKLTLCEFMGPSENSFYPTSPMAFDEMEATVGACIGAKIRDLACDYELFELTTDVGDVVLRRRNENIGFYCGEVLVIHENHRGKRLGVALVLAAVPNRNLPKKRTLSQEGDSVLRRAWRIANGCEENPWP